MVAHRAPLSRRRQTPERHPARARRGRPALRILRNRVGHTCARDRARARMGSSAALGVRVARRQLRALGKDGGRSVVRAERERHAGHPHPPRLEPHSARPPRTPRPKRARLHSHDGSLVGRARELVARTCRGGRTLSDHESRARFFSIFCSARAYSRALRATVTKEARANENFEFRKGGQRSFHPVREAQQLLFHHDFASRTNGARRPPGY